MKLYIYIFDRWNVLEQLYYILIAQYLQQREKVKKHIASIIHITHTCHIYLTWHICWLTEVNYFLKQTANYWKDVTNWPLNVQRKLKY